MKTLAVRVLGDFAVDGVEPQALGSRKARLALHLLALAQGGRVPSDVLIDALWGDAPPARPDDQVAVLMSRLRSVLGKERIEHRDGGYLLRCDWLDATELAALLDEAARRRAAGNLVGAAAAARVALGLVAGQRVADSAPGQWAELRRLDLDRLAGRARQAGAEVLLEAGDWAAAADAAMSALDRNPYDEAVLRVLMTARVMSGQAAEALAAYATAAARLAEDLGTDPSPQTVALNSAILRGELAAAPSAEAADAGIDAVGRDGELASLDALVARAGGGATQVAVVEGEAGIGKTTLLRAFAARQSAAGATVLVASCGPLDRVMPLDALLTALAGLLRRLGPQASASVLAADAALLAPVIGEAGGQAMPDAGEGMLGPGALYAATARVVGRISGLGRLVIVIDDAHFGAAALTSWVRFVQRAGPPIAVVAAVRAGERGELPATAVIELGVLGPDAAALIVGPARVAELYARSGGHPLFLTELAQRAAGSELPSSLVESVAGRCDELGTAAALLRAAAVIGPELDIDLLAAVLGRPVVELLDDAERATAKQLLIDAGGIFRFRHDLVRQALAASASAGRSALLHRQAGRVLARRPDADPVLIAQHARLGGDLERAARALRDAADRASERFEDAAAHALLDDALSLYPTPQAWLARARVRIRLGRYAEALDDVELAAPEGSAALAVGAWACYFDRRFAQAAQLADDGALSAADGLTRARCLAAGGRTSHAAGDLARAESLLGEALSLAEGADRVTAAAWLGVLRSHQSRTSEALALLRPAARGQIGVEHTSATLHALLFTGHCHALAGEPAAALDVFARYSAEVDRRQVPRFAGRAVNFSGWVLRNLGAGAEGMERHAEALEIGQHHGTSEVTIAAMEDLAECCLEAGDLDGARERLAAAAGLLHGDLVFGWRLALKHELLSCRLALACGDLAQAAERAADLRRRAEDLAVPRYSSVARLLVHRAARALGEPVDPAAVAADLDAVHRAVAIESWWWTGDLAADFGSAAWLDLATERVAELASKAGAYGETLRAQAGRRLAQWRSAVNLKPGTAAP